MSKHNYSQGGTIIIAQNLKTKKDYNFNKLDWVEETIKDTIYIKTSINRTYYNCPICGSNDIVKNGYNQKTVKHYTDAFWKYIYNIKIPKYKCLNCENCFFEKERFSLKNSSYSLETIFSILESLKNSTSTFTSVANQYHIYEQECLNIFDTHVLDPSKPSFFPEVLSFDEKFLNRNIAENGYSFVIVDWKNIKILDMIPSRHIDKIAAYFSKIKPEIRSNVKYITMDMYESYLRIAKTYFNNAIIVVDSFHVLQNLTRAFDKVRNKYLRKFDNGSDDLNNNNIEYYLLKKGANLLTKINGNLSLEYKYNKKLQMNISDYELVTYILNINPEIKKAYWLMQEYIEFNYHNTKESAEKEIDILIEKFFSSGIKSYEEFAVTLSHWKEYILNSFTYIYDEKRNRKRRLSEGPIEGINSQIAKIHTNGNGYKSFNRFKKVVIYKINKFLPYKF